MNAFCVVDYARGGRAVSTHATRDEAMKAAARLTTSLDPKRYRAERGFEGEMEMVEEVAHV
jgi:hypothetical protein